MERCGESQHPRFKSHSATLLPNGKVLVAGGYNDTAGTLGSVEVYDPASNTWSAAGSLNSVRYAHTATLLPNGKVLVAGGVNYSFSSYTYLGSAEVYDPASDTWSPAGSLGTARYLHTATLDAQRRSARLLAGTIIHRAI